MLVLDLNRLKQEGRARIDAEIPPGDPFWDALEVEPRSPLDVHLEAQQAGPDVVVRGTIEGSFGQECRRCLKPVEVGLEEELGLLYREGDELGEDEPEDVLPLPRGPELDLGPPVREQVLLGVPRYVHCREACKGLCPSCGTDLNEGTCECETEELDERWAPLRQLKNKE